MKEKGKLFIISGSSGVGKTTVVNELIRRHPEWSRVITTTTRKPRKDEENGKDYFFINEEEFKEKINKNSFIEYTEYAGNYYGTLKKTIEENIEEGKTIFLILDVIGGKRIKTLIPEATAVFLMVNNNEDLKERLEKRGDTKNIEERLQKVEEERKYIYYYDYVIFNEDFETCVQDLEELVKNDDFKRFKENFLQKFNELDTFAKAQIFEAVIPNVISYATLSESPFNSIYNGKKEENLVEQIILRHLDWMIKMYWSCAKSYNILSEYMDINKLK